MMRNILFLTLAEVVDIHSNQIELYRGLPGVRDINLLSSAIALPHASFHGEYLHNDIYEMAAAYAFTSVKIILLLMVISVPPWYPRWSFSNLMESAFRILRGNSTTPCWNFQLESLRKVSSPVY